MCSISYFFLMKIKNRNFMFFSDVSLIATSVLMNLQVMSASFWAIMTPITEFYAYIFIISMILGKEYTYYIILLLIAA